MTTTTVTITNFIDDFDILNWTQTLDGGFIQTVFVPETVTLISANGIPGEHQTTLSIVIPVDGTMTFNWNCTTTDSNLYLEQFGYILNGEYIIICADPSTKNENGTTTITLKKGDNFSFVAYTLNGISGYGSNIISNFTYVYTTYEDSDDDGEPPGPNDPSCFNEGTQILTLNKNFEEVYIPIENLRPGDIVKTYFEGYRKIKLIGKKSMINNPDDWKSCMFIMKKEGDMTADLLLTGLHSVLINELTHGIITEIYNKYVICVNDYYKFKKIYNTEKYTYYHIVIESDGNIQRQFAVWANGILAETTTEKDFKEHCFTELI
jgi:hypothetical protein